MRMGGGRSWRGADAVREWALGDPPDASCRIRNEAALLARPTDGPIVTVGIFGAETLHRGKRTARAPATKVALLGEVRGERDWLAVFRERFQPRPPDAARSRIAGFLERSVARGKMTEGQAKSLLDTLKGEDTRVQLLKPGERRAGKHRA